MRRHIPNIITLGNLACGLFAILFASSNAPWVGAYFIFGGLFLDFFDGFFARILKVDGELGKQLDSLADMVTFGVAPGMLMFEFLNKYVEILHYSNEDTSFHHFLPFVAFLIPLLSAVRLAKFNIATDQSDQFIGLPTPANAVFFAALILMVKFDESSFDFPGVEYLFSFPVLIGLIVALSLLLNAKVTLIALKFKNYGWKGNEIRYIFLGLSVVTILLSLLISNVFVAVPIIILLYLIISIINNITKRKDEVQSKH